jgi:hypothetical protein
MASELRVCARWILECILNVQTLGLGFAVMSLWKPRFTPVSLVRDARKIGS